MKDPDSFPDPCLAKKLYLRELHGSMRRYGEKKTMRMYMKCPERLQIPISQIFDPAVLAQGHVVVGFSRDGKYLLSYQCSVDTEVNPYCVSMRYSYTLFWWLFNLHKPIKLVYQVKLFHGEEIHQELHLSFCQPTHGRHIVVHGATTSHYEIQTSGPMAFVTIAKCPGESPLNHTLDGSNLALHLHYESLPPHPPFMPSVSLKMEDVILLNSGDVLTAIILMEKHSDSRSISNIEREHHLLNIAASLGAGSPSRSWVASESDGLCYCSRKITPGDHMTTISYHEYEGNISPSATNESNSSLVSLDKGLLRTMNTQARLNLLPEDNSDVPSGTNNTEEYSSSVEDSQASSIAMNTQFLGYVVQGFSYRGLNTHESQSPPPSPYDCTATVMPIVVTSADGVHTLKQSFEHRCYRVGNKGKPDNCDIYVSQAQFAAETFINNEINKIDDVSKRYVSLRDYDMQVVEVCPHTGGVIMTINALVILRDPVEASDTESSDRAVWACNLSVYTIGFTALWCIKQGTITVLRRHPLIEEPGSISKTRQFSPSLVQTVQLRKEWFVPSSQVAAVQTLSNHAVFSGQSLRYLLHPFLPLAIVL